MGIILTNNKKEIVEILKKRDEYVLEVSQKVLYAFPKDILFGYSSEKSFLEKLKIDLKNYSYYQVGKPKIVEIKKL